MPNTPEKWAVIRLGHMGDVVLTTGVLEYLRRNRGLNFTFITREAFAPLLHSHPAVSNIISVGPEALSGLGPWIAHARKWAKQHRGWGLLDLHGTLRSHILAGFWKGPVRRYPKFTLARRLYAANGSASARRKLLETNVPQRYAMALDTPAPPASELVPLIRITDAERKAARKRLAGLETGNRPAALHPYATHINKSWPGYRWDELISKLRKAGRDYVIIGRNETQLRPEDPHDLTNMTDLRETCALLAECSILVTGDSGPMHLAAGVGTPAVALFGPTDKAWGFYPAGPNDIVLENDLDCRPCSLHGKGECERGLACMAGITPDTVMRAMERHS